MQTDTSTGADMGVSIKRASERPVPAVAGPRTRRRTRGRRGYLYRRKSSAFWWYAVGYRGRTLRGSTAETDKKEAKNVLDSKVEELNAANAGYTIVAGPESKRVTVDQRLDWLVSDYVLRNVRSLPQVKSHLRPIREFFGILKVVELTEDDIDQYIRQRHAAKVAPATINRGLQLLGQALAPFLAKHRLPIPKIRKLPEDNAREGFAERTEFEAIVVSLPADLQDFARWAYYTGWRPGEIKSLGWADVEREARVIRLSWRSSKTKKARRMTLEGELWAIIQRRWAARVITGENGSQTLSDLVFHRGGRAVGDFRKAWRTARTAAGAPERHFYDFRRSGLRNMVRAGVDPAVAMKISGHRTRSTFDRYNIVSDDDIREAMAKTSAYLKLLPAEQTVLPLSRATDLR
jgi:integrase